MDQFVFAQFHRRPKSTKLVLTQRALIKTLPHSIHWCNSSKELTVKLIVHSTVVQSRVQYNYRRWTIELRVDLIEHTLANIHGIYILLEGEGGNRAVNLPSPYFLSQFLPPPYFFEPISTSSLNGYFSFSPFSLLFPPISPSSQLFLGHFSLLPILFLPPLEDPRDICL